MRENQSLALVAGNSLVGVGSAFHEDVQRHHEPRRDHSDSLSAFVRLLDVIDEADQVTSDDFDGRNPRNNDVDNGIRLDELHSDFSQPGLDARLREIIAHSAQFAMLSPNHLNKRGYRKVTDAALLQGEAI